MSTPSNKCSNTRNISDYWSSAANESDDAAQSPYAPKHGRLMPGGPPLELGNAALNSIPQFLVGVSPRTEATPQVAERAEEEKSGDSDFDRLEASLRWLEGEDSTVSSSDPGALPLLLAWRSADRAGALIEAPHSIQQESMLWPALTRAQRRIAHTPLATLYIPLLVAGLVAGIVAAKFADFVAVNLASEAGIAPEPKLAAAVETIVPLAPALHNQTPASKARTVAADQALSSKGENSLTVAIASSEPIAASPAVSNDKTVMLASRTGAQPSPESSPPRSVDPAEAQLLMAQGEKFMTTGDLATARVAFRRAAEAGGSDAALALGATYDPLFLAKIGALGVTPDPEKARSWYEKARQLGSTEAVRRLETLASR